MTTRHTTVRIPLDLWADIREAAEACEKTLSDIDGRPNEPRK